MRLGLQLAARMFDLLRNEPVPIHGWREATQPTPFPSCPGHDEAEVRFR
jgi:hypothetical protein